MSSLLHTRLSYIQPTSCSGCDGSSCSSRVSCDGADINLLPFPVVILAERKPCSSYMIPSFCAIQMELQHVFLECGSDAQGLDALVRVSRDLPAFNRPAPVVLEVLNCCIVPVSIWL